MPNISPLRVGNTILFESFGTGSQRLWSTDGTVAGTGPFAPSLLGNGRPGEGVLIGERYVFPHFPDGSLDAYDLWETDGTAVGTQQLGSFLGSPGELTAAGDVALVLGTRELFSVDPAGVVELLISDQDPLGNRVQLVPGEFGSVGLFEADFGLGIDPGLYATDGTAAGMVRVSDQFGFLGKVRLGADDRILFERTEQESGSELWIYDGVAQLSSLGLDVAPGIPSGAPQFGSVAGGQLLFSAFRIAEGHELHGLDIVPAGGFVAQPFGQGCGAVAFPDLALEGEVRIGETVQVQLSDFAPAALARLYLGFSAAAEKFGSCRVYLGGAPLPFADVVLDGSGQGAVPLAIPAEPALIGLTLFLQAASAGPGGPAPGGLELSNGFELRIGMP